MINKLKLTLAVGLISIANYAYGFDIDINQDDLSRLEDGYLIEDLAIGERAFVSKYAFCFRDGQLLLNKKSNTVERSEYSVNMLITINPKNSVTLNIKPQKDKTGFDVKEDVMKDFIPASYSCEYQEIFFNTEIDFYSVDNIDGYTSMSEYIKHLKDMGFKSKKEAN